jgi:hypothetical protein
MCMKGIRRLGLKIAERGSIVELYGLSNLTRSIRTCEEMEDKRKHVKTYRSHRNVAEIEREFINAV